MSLVAALLSVFLFSSTMSWADDKSDEPEEPGSLLEIAQADEEAPDIEPGTFLSASEGIEEDEPAASGASVTTAADASGDADAPEGAPPASEETGAGGARHPGPTVIDDPVEVDEDAAREGERLRRQTSPLTSASTGARVLLGELDSDETKEYYLKETKAPAGCVTPEGEAVWTTVATTADGLVTVEKTLENAKQAGPLLPLSRKGDIQPRRPAADRGGRQRPGLPPQERYQDELIPSVRPPNW